MDGGIDECMHEWLNGCTDGCKNGWCGNPGAQNHGKRPNTMDSVPVDTTGTPISTLDSGTGKPGVR